MQKPPVYAEGKLPLVSVVMPYFNRMPQLRLTLETYAHWYTPEMLEIILMDDSSPTEGEAEQLLAEFPFPYVYRYHPRHAQPVRNPASLFNRGAMLAQSDILMLTNPECAHAGDLITAALPEAREGAYVSMGCAERHAMPQSLTHFLEAPLHSMGMWYQSTSHTDFYYEAAFLKRSLFYALGGIDPSYDGGHGYEDHDFTRTMQAYGVLLIAKNEPYCVHLPHARVDMNSAEGRAAAERNRILYQERWK